MKREIIALQARVRITPYASRTPMELDSLVNVKMVSVETLAPKTSTNVLSLAMIWLAIKKVNVSMCLDPMFVIVKQATLDSVAKPSTFHANLIIRVRMAVIVSLIISRKHINVVVRLVSLDVTVRSILMIAVVISVRMVAHVWMMSTPIPVSVHRILPVLIVRKMSMNARYNRNHARMVRLVRIQSVVSIVSA